MHHLMRFAYRRVTHGVTQAKVAPHFNPHNETPDAQNAEQDEGVRETMAPLCHHP